MSSTLTTAAISSCLYNSHSHNVMWNRVKSDTESGKFTLWLKNSHRSASVCSPVLSRSQICCRRPLLLWLLHNITHFASRYFRYNTCTFAVDGTSGCGFSSCSQELFSPVMLLLLSLYNPTWQIAACNYKTFAIHWHPLRLIRKWQHPATILRPKALKTCKADNNAVRRRMFSC